MPQTVTSYDRHRFETHLDDERVNHIGHGSNPGLEKIELVVDRYGVDDPARNFPDLKLLDLLRPGRVVAEPDGVRNAAIRAVIIRTANAFVEGLVQVGAFDEAPLAVAQAPEIQELLKLKIVL